MTAMSKRVVMWASIAVLVAAGLALAFAPQPVPVNMVTIARSPMIVTVVEEGQTRIHDVFLLSAPVAGRVQRIETHVGDPVMAGETVLARIEPGDPSLLDPRSEAQARAAVQTAESALLLGKAEVDQAVAEFEFAQTELGRANELTLAGTISRRARDDAERAYKTGRALLATARAGLQMRQFELDQARAQLLSPIQTAQPHPSCDCVPITAPVSGRVLKILNPSERVVVAGEALIEIGDPRDLEIAVDFLSTDAVQVSVGQRVIIDGWGGRPLAGRVRRVEPFGFTKVSALGIDEQRVNVIINLEGPAEEWERLGHGYQIEAQVVLWESDAALTVPLTALFREQGNWAVFVEQSGRARLREIRIGRRNGLVAEVLEGLVDGDRVVVHPSNRVVPDIRVSARGDGNQ